MRLAGHVARFGKRRGSYRVLMGKPEGKNLLKDLSLDGRIILKWIFKKWDGGMDWIDLSQKRVRWRTFVNPVMHLTYLLPYLLTSLLTYFLTYFLIYLLPYLLTSLLTYFLTPWSRVLLEKLTSKLCN
jgi:hypothetical protein